MPRSTTPPPHPEGSGSREAEHADHLRAILNGLPAMVGYWDRGLRNRMANAAYEDFFGFTPELMRGMHIREVLGEDLYAINLPYMERALAGEAQLFDRAITAPSGEVRYTQASYIPDRAGEEIRGFFVLVTDITARRVAEEAKAAAEQRFRTLFEMAPIGTFLVSGGGLIVDANEAAAELLGYAHEDLVGREVETLVHPADRAQGAEQRAALLAGAVDAYRLEKRYLHADGRTVWAQLDARLLRADGIDEPLILGQVQDVSWRHERQRELEILATRDSLTGLLNRRGLLAALDQAVARVRREGRAAALVLLDLDRFKEVNDVLGHQAGDEVLVAVAELLRASDVAGRHGGDEFAVILEGIGRKEAEEIATQVGRRIDRARLGLTSGTVTASVGVAMIEPASTASEVLAQADAAMYRAKAERRETVARLAGRVSGRAPGS